MLTNPAAPSIFARTSNGPFLFGINLFAHDSTLTTWSRPIVPSSTIWSFNREP
jgi:hypothetical protein